MAAKQSSFIRALSFMLVFVMTLGIFQSLPVFAEDAGNDGGNSGASNGNAISIALSNSSLELKIGQTYTLAYSLLPEGAEAIEVEWLSSDSDIATVDDGVITAIAEGTTEITVHSVDDPSVAAVCNMEVVQATIHDTPSITLSDSQISLEVGGAYTLTYTLSPEGTEPFDVEWLTSDVDVATVTDGVVTAVAEGTAEITVRSIAAPSITAICAISVSHTGYFFDDAAHNAQQKNAFQTFAAYVGGSGSMIENEYIQFYVGKDLGSSVNDGRFTIGNTGGNPNYASDDNQILLFGHPNPWSSFTTIRISNVDYVFNANNTTYDPSTLTATSTMTVDNVLITQTLQLVNNEATGIKDTVKISYSAKNLSSNTKSVGVRIMMDTMLGNNDGAPFKVPSLGNVTYERELTGNAIPQSWQAFDSLTNANVFAVGTLYKSGDVKPDKVQFASWRDIYYVENRWEYPINTATPVTSDSAVAIYWNPKSVAAGATTSVNTYYGVGYASDGSGTVVGNVSSVPNSEYWVQVLNSQTRTPINGATVTLQGVSRQTNAQGIAKFSIPANTYTVTTMEVSASGYYTRTYGAVVKNGTQTTAALTSSLEVNVSSIVVDGKNVLNNKTIFSIKGRSNSVSINADWNGRVPYQYEFVQNGVVKHSSASSTFTLKIADTFSTNGDVYLRLIDSSRTVVKNIKTGITVHPSLFEKSGTYISLPGDENASDRVYSYTYKDSYFGGNSYSYNHELARMSLNLALAAFNNTNSLGSGYSKEYAGKRINNLLTEMGFKSINIDLYGGKPTQYSIGAAFGRKTIITQSDEEYTLIAIAVRGGGYENEWAGNFSITGTSEEHDGFSIAASQVKTKLMRYIMDNKISGNIKIWVTGYSRGAAVANLVAASLDDGLLSNAQFIDLQAKDIYAYTFETPQHTKSSNVGNTKYQNIFNVINHIDPVPKVAMSQWGYSRYGVNLMLPSNENSKQNYNNAISNVVTKYKGLTGVDHLSQTANQGANLDSIMNQLVMLLGSDGSTRTLVAASQGQSAVLNSSNKNDTSLLKKGLNGLLGLYANYVGLINGLDWNLVVQAHYPELCYAWMNTVNGTDYVSGRYRNLKINCPVNVNVYDSSNNLVASIIDHVVQSVSANAIEVFVDDYEQINIILPPDEDYRIEVIATGDGTVNYTISEYDDETGNHVRVMNFYDVPVTTGDVLTGTAPNTESVARALSQNYQLLSGNGIIPPSIEQSGNQIQYFDVIATVDGNGSVYGANSYLIGDYATLTATPNDSDTFIGWYDAGNNLLSTDTEYRFRVDADTTIVAKFTGVLVIPQICDIWVDAVKYEERQSVTGTLDFTMMLINAGTIDVASVDVRVVGSSLGEVYSNVVNCNLAAQSCEELAFGINVPEFSAPEDYTIIVNPVGQVNDSTNNVFDFRLGEYDLTISSNEYLDEGVYLSDITVSNFGSNTEAILRIHADEIDGAVLLERNLGNMIMGENLSLTCDLDSLVSDLPISTLYAVVSSPQENTEHSVDNHVLIVYSDGQSDDGNTDIPTPPIEPNNPDTPYDNHSDRGSSSYSPDTTINVIDPLANLIDRIKTAVQKAATETQAGQPVKATVQVKNATKITLSLLKQAADTARKAGGNVILHFDTMSADGKTVITRLYVKPELATKDIILSTNGVRAKNVKTHFEKYFKNKIAVLSFDQQGSFGMSIDVATKVDLTGMDTKNLYFYSYDKATNTYRRIEKPAYWIDKNGYLHFTTEYAGDIIISDGPLEPKEQF